MHLSAATEDDGATYTVSGSKNLSVGKNVRTVTVTAENGATRTYTITIIRAAAESGIRRKIPVRLMILRIMNRKKQGRRI